MPRENVVVGENGSIIELTRNSIGINGRVPSGKVLVDGLGVGDVGNIVLRDRRQLSQDGIMIVVVTIDKDTCSVAVSYTHLDVYKRQLLLWHRFFLIR